MENKTAEEYLKQWHIQDITIVLLDNKHESFGRIRKVPKEVKLSELLSDYSRNTEQQLAEKYKVIERLKRRKLVHQLFIDKVADILSVEKVQELLRESNESLNKMI